MTDWKAIDQYAIQDALDLQARQPRCDLPIGFLPTEGQVLPTDVIALWRSIPNNQGGVTFQAPLGTVNATLSNPLTIFNVMNYGAVGDGVTNDFTAIQNATNAAGVAGGIVWFPVPPGGKYVINGTHIATTGAGTIFMGVDRGTCVIQQQSTDGVIHVGHDYCEVRNLTLDATLTNSTAFIGQNCNYCTVDNCIGLGSSTQWEVFWFYGPTTEPGVNPPNQPVYTYNYGNRFTNNVVHGNTSGGTLDFSHQANAFGSNNIVTGYWIVAYQCNGVIWDTTYFTAQTPAVGTNGTLGFAVVAPSNNVTIRNFYTTSAVTARLSSGNEAMMGVNPSWGSVDTTLDNVYLGPGSILSISDCTVTRITRLYMDANSVGQSILQIGPESDNSSPNPGGKGVNGLKISDSVLSQIRLGQNFNGGSQGSIYDVIFENCTFTPVAYLGGTFTTTFRNSTVQTAACGLHINGGYFKNTAQGLMTDDNFGPLATPSNLAQSIIGLIGWNYSGAYAGKNWISGAGVGIVPVTLPPTLTIVPNYPGVPMDVAITAPSGNPVRVLVGQASDLDQIVSIPAGTTQIVGLDPTAEMQVIYTGANTGSQWLWFVR